MLAISFFRILSNALRNFQRNVWLSIATTMVMTLTLLMMMSLYFINVLGSEVLRGIEQKVDLSVVFNDSTTPAQIDIIASEMRSRDDVEEVRIVTPQEALDTFRRRHASEPFFEESLRELEANPLPASMFVVATNPRFYQNIAQTLSGESLAPYIEKVNYENSRSVIEKLINVMSGVRNVGLITTIVLSSLVILIMFNTIRLAIYSFREEIDIMRLVGASNWFIRGPFIIEAILVALLGVLVTSLILYPALKAVSPQIQQFFFGGLEGEGVNLYIYALQNWVTVVGLQVAAAVGLAVLSSFVAIRRYLR